MQAKIDSANAFTDLDAIKRTNINLSQAAAVYEKEIRSLKSELARYLETLAKTSSVWLDFVTQYRHKTTQIMSNTFIFPVRKNM